MATTAEEHRLSPVSRRRGDVAARPAGARGHYGVLAEITRRLR